MEVALQPPALGVAGLDDPRARGAQLLQARAQLGVELGEAAAQQAAEEGEGHQRVAMKAGHQAASPAPARATVTSANVSSEKT